MLGTFEMHDNVARVADIEIPVWRRHNRDRESLVPFPFDDIETALHWLLTNRANITRFLVLHGCGKLIRPPAIASPRIAHFMTHLGNRYRLGYASFSNPSRKSFTIPASTSFRFFPHRIREVFSTSRYCDSSPCFGIGAKAFT